jgi:GNAT superfamily N-acetyltransferase
MRYFVFNFNSDQELIPSYLRSVALAHKHAETKGEDWFYWKFRDNPYGESIVVCAESEGEVVGSLAFGMQAFDLAGGTISGSLVFEAFVHPGFQGRGIFKRLIQLAEDELARHDIAIAFAFPNSMSLPGFSKAGWTKLESPEYWIKPLRWVVWPQAANLRKSFIPNAPNLGRATPIRALGHGRESHLSAVINVEFLHWRFNSYPVAEYAMLEAEGYQVVLRIGQRGSLKEAQVLLIRRKREDRELIRRLMKSVRCDLGCDILSFPISKYNSVREDLRSSRFLKVPNRANAFYKRLIPSLIADKEANEVSISAINYHTY